MWAVCISSAVLLGIASIVGAVDPFNSGILPIRFNIDRVETFRRQNVALWSALDIEKDPVSARQQASVVVLGDSRGEMMRGGYNFSRTFQIADREFYDLSFGGASIYEMIAFFRHYRGDFRSLETVVIVLPFSKLVSSNNAYDRSQEAFSAAESSLSYLLDHRVLLRSAGWLIYGKRDPTYRPPPRHSRAPSQGHASEPLCRADAETAQLTEKFLKFEKQQLKIAKAQWRATLKDVLLPFIDELRASGIKTVVAIPPLSPPVKTFLEGSMLKDASEYEAAIGAVSSVFKVSSTFEGTTGWADAVHICNESALQILPMLVSGFDQSK